MDAGEDLEAFAGAGLYDSVPFPGGLLLPLARCMALPRPCRSPQPPPLPP